MHPSSETQDLYDDLTQPLLSPPYSTDTFPSIFCITRDSQNCTNVVTRYFLLPVSQSLYFSGVPLYDVPLYEIPTMSVRNKDVLPSAPPLELLEKVPGYETTGYDAATVTPPNYLQEFIIPPPPSIKNSESMTEGVYVTFQYGWRNNRFQTEYQIKEHEAKLALLHYADEHCCYGTAAARNMSIMNIKYSSAFAYRLETFTEIRQRHWVFEPYNGESIDGVSNGTAPQPWKIEVSPPKPFVNHTEYKEVPHTASLRSCHQCINSPGKIKDATCHGDGNLPCIHCHGDGNRLTSSGFREQCHFCNGRGHEKCETCNGSGFQTCKTCDGKGQLKYYIRLTIKWKNNVDEHIAEKIDIPDKVFRRISGKEIYSDEQIKVTPVQHFPNNEIVAASVQFLEQHDNRFSNEKILKQRHTVSVIPLNEIHYKWKGHQGKFFVCGQEKEVYAPEYPQSCCWGLGNCVIF